MRYRGEMPTEAEENLAYWQSFYDEGKATGRGIYEFGMQWMMHQIKEWADAVRKERE